MPACFREGKERCVGACCSFRLTHLPISQVCAPCPPPVDTAPAHHWDHNCRLLKDKAGLSHYEKHTQYSIKTVNKETISPDSLTDEFCSSSRSSGLRKIPNPFSITHRTEEQVCFKKKFWIRGLQFPSRKGNQFTLLVAELGTRKSGGSWSLIYSSFYCFLTAGCVFVQRNCVTQTFKAFWWFLIETDALRLCLTFQ